MSNSVSFDSQYITLSMYIYECIFFYSSVLRNITEAEVYIEQIFKANTVNAKGEGVIESEVVFHAIQESTQSILTNDEVLRYV